MQRFTELFTALDQTTKTLGKVQALVDYFEGAADEDKMWTIALLSHRRPKRTVNTTYLAEWAAELSGLPGWLFEESYHVVGDLAETITLLLPKPTEHSEWSLTEWINFIRALEQLAIEEKKEKILWAWNRLTSGERFVFNKLITGSFRVGVSQQLMVKALARFTKTTESNLAHLLMGNWSPTSHSFQQLMGEGLSETDYSRPYPFYLAYAIDEEFFKTAVPHEWQAERKWDGIRGQIIVRDHQLFVWSRGEELVTDKYPEYHDLVNLLPEGTVLDGEILPFKDNKPMSFQFLQQRIGRKVLSAKLLKEVAICFVAYDILELNGHDLRDTPLSERRKKLEDVCEVHSEALRISPIVSFNTWHDLAAERLKSREYLSEGIMLKRKDSVYREGRRRGDWWKWKIDALTIDAVMIYAMHGSGRRANLYTDYTFAVWDGGVLVPFTKAYSGLTDAEILEVDRWVKSHTVEKFGPVRSVEPALVFEIAFEGIQRSTRHKSGIALRFPRMHRWRKDKPAAEANSLADLRQILDQVG